MAAEMGDIKKDYKNMHQKNTGDFPCQEVAGFVNYNPGNDLVKAALLTWPADKGYMLSPNPSLVIKSTVPYYESDGYAVILLGKLTDIFLSDYDLDNYIDNQELVIEQMFTKYNKAFLPLIAGYFLIILYDKKRRALYLFNNRYQATNIYYYADKKIFVFASSLKLLLKNLPFKPTYDKQSLPAFLATGYSQTEHMQFQNVCRMLPTAYFMLEEGEVVMENHWPREYSFDRKPFKNLEEHLNKYEQLFQKGISKYLKFFDVRKLGCLLSGGQDTSFVYIMASKVYKKPIHTFIASFAGDPHDEFLKAKKINDMYKGLQHRVVVEPKDLDYIPQMVRACEEPVSGGSLVFYLCAREAGKYVDTILSGDPGDTLWGEYYPVAEWHKILKRMPVYGRKVLWKAGKIIKSVFGWERFWELEHVFSLFKADNFYGDFFRNLCTYRQYDKQQLRRIFNNASYPDIDFKRCLIDLQLTSQNFSDYLIEAKMLYGVYTYMLSFMTKCLESQGIKLYPAYMNKEIIEFITSLPLEWVNGGSVFSKLANKGIKRKFHKKVLERYLPRELVYSLQQSLDIPFHALFGPRPELLKNLLKALKKRKWFNDEELEKLFYEFPKQRVNPRETCELKHHGYRIYSLLTFEVWYREFVADFPGRFSAGETIPLEEYFSL